MKAADYNPLALQPESYFTQGILYGHWQKAMGRQFYRRVISLNGEVVGTFQAISYELSAGTSYLYIPHGPVLQKEWTPALVAEFYKEVKAIARVERAAFVRFDSFPPVAGKLPWPHFHHSPYASYYGAYFQSKYDWVLDISRSDTAILATMHEKTRYSIGLSTRKGITVKQVSGVEMSSYFETFYDLMVETSIRGDFHLHPKEYYRQIFLSAAHDPSLVLFIASYEEKILATYLVIFYGATAFYPFGGSSKLERNRMPTHALHWAAIKEGKQRGCKWYNFGAIDVGEKVSHDGWDGISSFKRKWGGELREYSDFHDIIFKPFWYYLYIGRKLLRSFRK